jgi:Na+/melibiose symporter-like transporter
MIPSMTFSRACRSTLNGVCAACGKVGALLGTMLFVPVAARFGDELVMISCAVISILGFALTWLCIPEELDADKHNEQILRRMNWAERLRVEQRLNRTPMKIVYSNPSLLDCHDEV